MKRDAKVTTHDTVQCRYIYTKPDTSTIITMLIVHDPLPDGQLTTSSATLGYSVQHHCSFISLVEGLIQAIHVHLSLEKRLLSANNLKENKVLYVLVSF